MVEEEVEEAEAPHTRAPALGLWPEEAAEEVEAGVVEAAPRTLTRVPQVRVQEQLLWEAGEAAEARYPVRNA